MEAPAQQFDPHANTRAPRVPFVRPVHVRAANGSARARRLFAIDLSAGGMFLRSPRPFPPGTEVELFFEAGGRVLTFGRGEVTWQRPVEDALQQGRLAGFGVKFLPLPEKAQALVERLMEIRGTARVGLSHFAAALNQPILDPPESDPAQLPPRATDTAEQVSLAAASPAVESGSPSVVVDPDALGATLRAVPLAPAQDDKAIASAGRSRRTRRLLVAALAAGVALAALARVDWRQVMEQVSQRLNAARGAVSSVVESAATSRSSSGAGAIWVEASFSAGGVRGLVLRAEDSASELELITEGEVVDAFTVQSPPQLVVDVVGASPSRPESVELAAGVQAAQLFSHNGGTRLVLELDRPVQQLGRRGSRLSLRFAVGVARNDS